MWKSFQLPAKARLIWIKGHVNYKRWHGSLRLTSAGANRLEASVQDLWTSSGLHTPQGS